MSDPTHRTHVDENELDRLLLGRMVLGRYCVDGLLGRGGTGAVYRLRHVELPDTYAALKVLYVEGGLLTSSEAKERFRQEAMIAASVGSHRVARPMDVGEFEDGMAYIVMEYAAGQSLEQLLASGETISIEHALDIALRVADTMVIAHKKGIVHRDLKPGNIMLVPEGTGYAVKLLDFGAARASGSLRMAHTSQGFVVGTPGYMSPEAMTGQSLDGKTDTYSLGVVLFEMLTGQRPHTGETLRDIAFQVLSPDPPPRVPSKRPASWPKVPELVEDLIGRALIKDVAWRPDMERLLGDLTDALSRITDTEAAAALRAQRMQGPSTMILRPRADETLAAMNLADPLPPPPAPGADAAGVPGMGTTELRPLGLVHSAGTMLLGQRKPLVNPAPTPVSSLEAPTVLMEPVRDPDAAEMQLLSHRSPLVMVAVGALLLAVAAGVIYFALSDSSHPTVAAPDPAAASAPTPGSSPGPGPGPGPGNNPGNGTSTGAGAGAPTTRAPTATVSPPVKQEPDRRVHRSHSSHRTDRHPASSDPVRVPPAGEDVVPALPVNSGEPAAPKGWADPFEKKSTSSTHRTGARPPGPL